MVDTATLLNISDWIASLLILVSLFLMFRIAKITGWFGAWGTLYAAFVLIFVRRVLSAYSPFSTYGVQLSYINSILQLILSVLYIFGFYRLYILFKEKGK